MGRGNSGLFRGTYGAIPAIGNISYMLFDDKFYKNISKRKDIDPNGYFDVIAHGQSDKIEINTGSKKYLVNHRIASKIIKEANNYHKGQATRLIFCNTGRNANGFAQNLANKLNVPVMVPTKYAFAYPNGKHFVAGSIDEKTPNYNDIGEYKVFYPNRRIKNGK